MKDKKHVKYTKYKKFRHTTESKRKNMVGNNPEVEKRKALVAALNPSYTSSSTLSAGQSFVYTPKNEK
ncbi:MAG: hypothetical protein NTU98_14765 [Bacteroidetes bacterium]|nr:hypothetical protein [Bacteroidota bacterium]